MVASGGSQERFREDLVGSMGDISQFFDLNHTNTSRNFLGHKPHDDGLEAPRNSLEFPMEASQGYHLIDEDIPYSFQVKNASMKVDIYPSEAPIKTLIVEELSNRLTNRCSTPSVVARLMGMDTLPSEIKPIIHTKECRDERLRNIIPRIEPTEICPDYHISLGSIPFKQTKQELLPYSIKLDSSQHTRNFRSTKPQPREHPQEELLQKFKIEFEAWQASKVWEHSRNLDLDSKIQQVKDHKILAQENLNGEKLARFADAKRNSAHDAEMSYYISSTKPEIGTWQGSGLQNEGYIGKQHQLISKDGMALMNSVETNDSLHLPVAKIDKTLHRTFSSTRIVILKPSSEGSNDIDESLVGSSNKLDKVGTMEDFLKEVKERLKHEIQGRATIRGIETETYFTEKSTGPKQIAQHISKQIRESVTRDIGTSLERSESTRSYRSQIQSNGPDSPGLISRDTRKLLSDRLKNVLKNEKKVEVPLVADVRSRASLEGMKLRTMYDFSEMGKKAGYREDKKSLAELKTRFFRHDQHRNGSFDTEAASPRNLVRSFSAPVSGTAFGKLLLEDQHILTGAQISRKHEASEHASVEVRKTRKDGFNLRDRVSSLRHNFSLRGKLFRKKTQSMHDSDAIEVDSEKAILTTPSVVMNFGTAQDNFTEVPPSPASVSSSSYDDCFRPGHPSPDSPLEVPFIEDHSSPLGSGEFNSKLPEPKSLLEQVANDGPEVTTEGETYEDGTAEVEGHPEAYARKILISAGLYEGQAFDLAFSKLDALTNPISKWVFNKVEEVYPKNGNADEEGSSHCCGDTGLSRKMFFDLMNEALPRVLGPPIARLTFKKFDLCPDAIPRGRQLLHDLMHQIQIYIDYQVDEFESLDSKVVWDLKMTSWPTKPYEETEVMGRQMESVILRDLIDELVLDMCS